jgi:hypothetical protein
MSRKQALFGLLCGDSHVESAQPNRLGCLECQPKAA